MISVSISAVKAGIEDVVSGLKEQSLVIRGLKTAQVRVMGRVVDKFVNNEKTYGSITLDDETGTIRAKFFASEINNMSAIKLGDLVDIVGRVRKFQEEIHIVVDAVAVLENMNWELLRKLELSIPDTRLEKEVLSEIKKGNCELDALKSKFGEDITDTIGILLNKGELYESSPKKYSYIE